MGGFSFWLAAGLSQAKQDGALAFLQCLNRRRHAAEWAKRHYRIPITRAAVDVLDREGWFQRNPQLRMADDQLEAADGSPASLGPLLGGHAGIMGELTSAMHDVLVGDAEPATSFAGASERAQQILDAYNSYIDGPPRRTPRDLIAVCSRGDRQAGRKRCGLVEASRNMAKGLRQPVCIWRVAMSLNHSLVGVPGEPCERSWTSKDALLYAIGVGAGLGDPLRELEFTTENSEGVEQKVLPTYGVVLAQLPSARSIGDFDRAMLVLAEQYVELHRPLPVSGTVRTSSTVTGIYDKRSGALVESESVAVDPASGEPVITARSGMFIRGQGGFGGDRGTPTPRQPADRDPDHRVVEQTRPEQALLYRLSGDRNPLHADPRFAARGGFSRPILHGPCTYGFTGRVLLHELCGSDPARFISMSGRFSAPVTPGDSLVVSIWRGDDGTASFQTAKADGTVVIDRGQLRYRGSRTAP